MTRDEALLEAVFSNEGLMTILSGKSFKPIAELTPDKAISTNLNNNKELINSILNVKFKNKFLLTSKSSSKYTKQISYAVIEIKNMYGADQTLVGVKVKTISFVGYELITVCIKTLFRKKPLWYLTGVYALDMKHDDFFKPVAVLTTKHRGADTSKFDKEK